MVGKAADSESFALALGQEARDVLKGQGLMAYDEKERSEVIGGSALVAWNGSLFMVDGGCAPTELRTFGAIGTGSEVATGAVWAIMHLGLRMEPGEVITRAVETACALSPYCRPPVVVMEV